LDSESSLFVPFGNVFLLNGKNELRFIHGRLCFAQFDAVIHGPLLELPFSLNFLILFLQNLHSKVVFDEFGLQERQEYLISFICSGAILPFGHD